MCRSCSCYVPAISVSATPIWSTLDGSYRKVFLSLCLLVLMPSSWLRQAWHWHQIRDHVQSRVQCHELAVCWNPSQAKLNLECGHVSAKNSTITFKRYVVEVQTVPLRGSWERFVEPRHDLYSAWKTTAAWVDASCLRLGLVFRLPMDMGINQGTNEKLKNPLYLIVLWGVCQNTSRIAI